MKRITAMAIAATTAASLIMSAAPALAKSGPNTTTEVAHSGKYESIVSCPNWGGAMGKMQPLLSAPYAPASTTGGQVSSRHTGTSGRTEPYDPLVTCTVTFLQKPDPPKRDPLFAVDPGLTTGPMASAMARACAREHRSMHLGALSCCASSRTGHRMAMFSCCAPTRTASGHLMFACCTTPRSGHRHMFACCDDLHSIAAFMPACLVLNTGYGGMAGQVARHQPVAAAKPSARTRRTAAGRPR